MNKVLIVSCPKCKSEFEYYSSKFRPFCCERCKEVDLGAWLTGEYSVEGEAGPEDGRNDNED